MRAAWRAALALACLAGTAGMAADPALVWAPLLDQTVQRSVECGQGPLFAHPRLKPGQDSAAITASIRTAVEASYAKGVRVIDVQFLISRDRLQPEYARDYRGDSAARAPAVWDPTLRAFASSGEDWVRAVDSLNRRHPSDPIRLRIRLPAFASTLYYVYRTAQPFDARLDREDPAQGIVRSRHKDLPADPCFEIPDSRDSCFPRSPVPADYYRTRTEDGRMSNTVANLGNPAVRRHIALWTGEVIDQVKALTAPPTRIEEVSLVLDAGGESGLFARDDGGVVSFSGTAYKPDTTLSAKAAFYRSRESLLKAAYMEFAGAVHSKINRDGSSIRAGVFQQAHHLDGRSRGTFDLYALLKGSGIDVLHHTQPPGTLAQNLMWTLFSASVAAKLGIHFDTEFSWAHFGGPDHLAWTPSKLTASNAIRFRRQAQAGGRYGASAIVFANWTMNEWIAPPSHPEWEALVGRPAPRWSRAHLGRKDGLFAASRFPEASRDAIYISTAGRMECEEKAAGAPGPGTPCNVHTYLGWFREFGLLRSDLLFRGRLFDRRIDILTDGMILDNPKALAGYERVWMPNQTSRRVASPLLGILRDQPDSVKARIRFQMTPGAVPSGTYGDWLKIVEPLD